MKATQGDAIREKLLTAKTVAKKGSPRAPVVTKPVASPGPRVTKLVKNGSTAGPAVVSDAAAAAASEKAEDDKAVSSEVKEEAQPEVVAAPPAAVEEPAVVTSPVESSTLVPAEQNAEPIVEAPVVEPAPELKTEQIADVPTEVVLEASPPAEAAIPTEPLPISAPADDDSVVVVQFTADAQLHAIEDEKRNGRTSRTAVSALSFHEQHNTEGHLAERPASRSELALKLAVKDDQEAKRSIKRLRSKKEWNAADGKPVCA